MLVVIQNICSHNLLIIIKICFLRPNTTSKLQPLDLGIIQNFKVHYRRFLLRYVLSKIDECETASEVANSVNILIAIRWVAQAWENVKEETICKCFRRAGVLNSTMDVVSCEIEEDPFADIDESADLQGLMNDILPTNVSCSVQEYVNGDDNVPICHDMDDDSWEETFMSQLGHDHDIDEQEQEQDKEDDMQAESVVPTPNITTFKDAIIALEDVQNFLENRGHASISMTHVGPAIDAVVSVQIKSMRQHTLQEYFNTQESYIS